MAFVREFKDYEVYRVITIMNQRTLALSMGLVLGLCGAASAATIAGTVTFEGRAPTMPQLNMEGHPQCEHAELPRVETLVLGEGQRVANMLIHIKSGLPENEYAVPEEPVVVTQAGCIYTPHVFGIRVGQPLKFTNPDGVLHNMNAQPTVNREFNISMPEFRKSATRTFTKAEAAFPIKCDVHKWMGTWCAVFDHPFFDVTQQDGEFRIDGLDAGTYEIEAWHERLGTQTTTVTVGIDEEAMCDFSFSRPSK